MSKGGRVDGRDACQEVEGIQPLEPVSLLRKNSVAGEESTEARNTVINTGRCRGGLLWRSGGVDVNDEMRYEG